jgi:hypothetical protein
MTLSTLYNTQDRLRALLTPHVHIEDAELSDADLVHTVKNRFDLEWRRRQALIDPNE